MLTFFICRGGCAHLLPLDDIVIDFERISELCSKIANVFKTELSIDVYVFSSIEEWKSFWEDHHFPEWVCALASENAIYIKDQSLWSENNIGTFEETLAHEIVHCYVEGLSGGNMPVWMSEGLAIFLSDQGKYYEKVEIKDVEMESLDYGSDQLYDLSISKLWERLKLASVEELLRPFLLEEGKYEAEYSKSIRAGS